MAMLKSLLLGCLLCRPGRLCNKQEQAAEDGHYDVLPKGPPFLGTSRTYSGQVKGGVQIAVKRLEYGRFKEINEFHKQAQLLGSFHHKNLLELYGYCAEGQERLLVSKYMPNSSLHAHLRGERQTQAGHLDWQKRMVIAKGCAEGLAYLHQSDLVHGALKSSNVLLSLDYEPKLADFGMATLLKEGVPKPRGPVGYGAPEDAKGEENLSKRSDVFSFGIVLLELVSGKDPAENVPSLPGKLSIVEWVQSLVMGGKLDELVDPQLGGAYDREDLERLLNTAIMCAQEKPENRPSMWEVVEYLTGRPQAAGAPLQ